MGQILGQPRAASLAQRDDTLDKGVQVGAATRQANGIRAGVSEHLPNTRSEDRVAIHDEVSLP